MIEKAVETQLKEVISHIPDYPFTEEDFAAMRSGFSEAVNSLGSSFPMHPLERKRFMMPSEINDPDFEQWYQSHSWIPDDNSKASESGVRQRDFVRVFFYNPTARVWVDRVREKQGAIIMKRMFQVSLRLDAHLNRMLSHYDVETQTDAAALTDFSLALLNYLGQGDASVRELQQAIPFHGYRGGLDGAVQFWTVAPYIYEALVQCKVNPMSAVISIIEWGKARHIGDEGNNDCDFPGMRNLRNED